MNIEDTIGYQSDETICIVCGKGLKPGEALATLHKEGSKLPICCPLCFETYQQNSKFYQERLARRILIGELRKSPTRGPAKAP